jgi:hypothetical protein
MEGPSLAGPCRANEMLRTLFKLNKPESLPHFSCSVAPCGSSRGVSMLCLNFSCLCLACLSCWKAAAAGDSVSQPNTSHRIVISATSSMSSRRAARNATQAAAMCGQRMQRPL